MIMLLLFRNSSYLCLETVTHGTVHVVTRAKELQDVVLQKQDTDTLSTGTMDTNTVVQIMTMIIILLNEIVKYILNYVEIGEPSHFLPGLPACLPVC